MPRKNISKLILSSALVALSCLCNPPAHADEKFDNPKYALWSKFKPGSTSTVSADFDVQGKKFHVDVTKTLVSITDDELVVGTVVTATVMDHQQVQPNKNETIPAKTDKLDFQPTGDKDIDAMGKTFKCKVWNAKGGDPNSKPANPADAMANLSATIYTNDQVPGGLVKLEGMGKSGTPLTFVLTAMDAK